MCVVGAGCTLTKENPEVMWAAGKTQDDEDEDDDDFMQETLFVRHVSATAALRSAPLVGEVCKGI